MRVLSRCPVPLALALVGCAMALPARAADDAGPYATVFVGSALQRDQALSFSDGSTADRGNAAFDPGLAAGGAFGYRFDSGWRLEAEFLYQSVDRSDAVFAAAGPRGKGNYASTSVAVNGLYEFAPASSPRVHPYIGIGLARLTEVDIDFESGGTERSFSGSGSGVQALAGVRIDLRDAWSLDAGVRYLRATGLTLDEEGGSGRIEADYGPWAVTVGVAYRF